MRALRHWAVPVALGLTNAHAHDTNPTAPRPFSLLATASVHHAHLDSSATDSPAPPPTSTDTGAAPAGGAAVAAAQSVMTQSAAAQSVMVQSAAGQTLPQDAASLEQLIREKEASIAARERALLQVRQTAHQIIVQGCNLPMRAPEGPLSLFHSARWGTRL